jgi:N-acetylgalactosamine-6-sulfatase
LVAILVAPESPVVALAEDAPRPPNVIFILADDLGWGDLGCYGNPHIQTPHLDELAKQGTLFAQFYVNGSVCSPTRAAFLTGQYPARHGIHGHLADHARNANRGMPNWLDPAATVVTQLLKESGYATAHFGKWHLGSGPGAPEPEAYGVDEYCTVNGNGPIFAEEGEEYFRARSTGLIVDETIRFIEAHRDAPFYVNLWTLVPHAPLHPTARDLQPYERFRSGQLPYSSAQQIYYASVTSLDRELGRLFAKLDELQLAENTLVLFSSDNGPEDIHIRNAAHSGVGTAGPFRGRKRSLYEGGVRVPLIARWPGKIPSGRIDEESIVSAVDFLPTLCSLGGSALPENYRADGEDMSDVLQGHSRPRNKPLLWEWRFLIAGYPYHHSPMLSIRDGQWKLLLNPDRSRVELYDIPHDRMELHNLAALYPDVVERLANSALTWQATLPGGPVEKGAGEIHYGWPEKRGSQ